jgi:hypothetical protein
MTWRTRFCAAVLGLAASVPVQAQVVLPATAGASPPDTVPLVVLPVPEAVEALECRSLLTLLQVAIPPWERAVSWFEEPFVQREPTAAEAAARQRCLELTARPMVHFEDRTAPAAGAGSRPKAGM